LTRGPLAAANAIAAPAIRWRQNASMSNEARRAAVAALVRLAESSDYHDRADAGRSLASFAEMPEARGPLLDLVLDDGNTLVTRATAMALLQRHDPAGLAVVASALAAAADPSTADPSTADWIYSAVYDVFMVFSRGRDAAARECEVLARDPDEQVRCGAVQLTAMLAEINPILRLVQND
jgi:hypothetical protein